MSLPSLAGEKQARPEIHSGTASLAVTRYVEEIEAALRLIRDRYRVTTEAHQIVEQALRGVK